jgi:hypothetical protein
MLKIDGVLIPTPSEFTVGVQDISQAERVASGRIVIDRIATKIKLNMKWKYLTPTQLSDLLTAIDKVYFDVEYLDPRTNTMQTREFYVGDRTVGMYSYRSGNPIYVDIGFNFIEV